mgnify:CR=1 FL=1
MTRESVYAHVHVSCREGHHDFRDFRLNVKIHQKSASTLSLRPISLPEVTSGGQRLCLRIDSPFRCIL